MERLDLSRNALSTLDDDSFSTLDALTSLDLSENKYCGATGGKPDACSSRFVGNGLFVDTVDCNRQRCS